MDCLPSKPDKMHYARSTLVRGAKRVSRVSINGFPAGLPHVKDDTHKKNTWNEPQLKQRDKMEDKKMSG
jgi:hypothetical protein